MRRISNKNWWGPSILGFLAAMFIGYLLYATYTTGNTPAFILSIVAGTSLLVAFIFNCMSWFYLGKWEATKEVSEMLKKFRGEED